MYVNTSRTERAISLPFVIASQRYSLVLQARLIENERFYHRLERKVADSFVHSLARSLAHSFVRSHSRLARQLWISILDRLRKFNRTKNSTALFLSTFRATHMRTKIQCDKLMHDSLCTTGVRRRRETSQRCFPLRTRTRGANWDLCARERNSVPFSCMFIKQIYWDVIKHSI